MVADLSLERASILAEFDALRGRAFAPLSTRTPREFAETVMRMPGAHGTTQPFSFSYAPYQLEPYLEIFNPRNVEVDMMMFSRGGKSRIVLTALGFVIVEQPCRIGAMWPVEGDGKLWVKDDFMGELVEPTPEIAAIIENTIGQRKSSNTILHKRFAGGSLTTMGANAPGRMRRMKARVLYADEIDAIIEIKTDEGDQLKIFAKRGSEFPDCIQIYCSYPSVKGKSRIEAKLLASDLRQWFVTCLACGGEPFIMSRTGSDPFNDKFKRSRLVYDSSRPQEARLECPACGALHDDAARYAMMMGGDPEHPRYDLWKPTRPFTGRAGFHASSLLWPHPVDPAKYPGGFLEILARKEIEIETSENPERARRVLVNTDDAETYQAASDIKPEHSKLFLRREAWAGVDEEGNPKPWDLSQPIPAGVLAVVFFTDVQDDRLEMFIEGHGLNQQIWQLGYIIIKGGKGCALVPPDQGVWAEHDRVVDTTAFAHPSGRTLRIFGGLVDAGDKRDHVFAYTRTRGRRKIFASRGDTELCKPIVESRARKEGKHRTRVYVLGTHAAKEIIYQRLDQDNPSSHGYRHYPVAGWCSEHFFKMLVAENSEDRQARDGEWYKWFGCDQGVRNESLDGAVGCMAAAKILRLNFEKLAEQLRVRTPGEAPANPTAPAAASIQNPKSKIQNKQGFVSKGLSGRNGRPGRGFVGKWKC